MVKKSGSIWSEENYGGKEYDRLGNFPPKLLLDDSIAQHIIKISSEDEILKNQDSIIIAELFAGRAPISRILKKESKLSFKCHAFDMNEGMRGRKAITWVDHYNSCFDATKVELADSEIEKYDWVVIENGLYATTISDNGTRPFTSQEAKVFRTIALQKAFSMLKPGGYLILSEPLKTSSDFGINAIYNFLQKDIEARKLLNTNLKSFVGVIWEYLFEYIMSRRNNNGSSMIDVLKRNKKFISKTDLLTHKEILEVLKSMGHSERIILSKDDDYLGSNGTYLLRKRLENNIQNKISQMLSKPISLDYPVHDEILITIGKFRRKVYLETNATNYLPIIDKYDKKSSGRTIVFFKKHNIGLAAVATLQPRHKIGLDIESIMKPINHNNFYEGLIQSLIKDSEKVRKAIQTNKKEFNIAELRRLAADNLSRTELIKFLNFLWMDFTSYSKVNEIDIVLFISDEKRLRVFNKCNKINPAEFKVVKDFDLIRTGEKHQTMMVAASSYFFGSWEELKKEKILNDYEIVNIQKLKTKLQTGKNWREIAENVENSVDVISSIHKLIEQAPSNINLYYSDYLMSE